jgi:hypothetical protein
MANGTSGIVDISAMDIALKNISRKYDELLKKQSQTTDAGVQKWRELAREISNYGNLVGQASKRLEKGFTIGGVDKVNKDFERLYKIIDEVWNRVSRGGDSKNPFKNLFDITQISRFTSKLSSAESKINKFREALEKAPKEDKLMTKHQLKATQPTGDVEKDSKNYEKLMQQQVQLKQRIEETTLAKEKYAKRSAEIDEEIARKQAQIAKIQSGKDYGIKAKALGMNLVTEEEGAGARKNIETKLGEEKAKRLSEEIKSLNKEKKDLDNTTKTLNKNESEYQTRLDLSEKSLRRFDEQAAKNTTSKKQSVAASNEEAEARARETKAVEEESKALERNSNAKKKNKENSSTSNQQTSPTSIAQAPISHPTQDPSAITIKGLNETIRQAQKEQQNLNMRTSEGRKRYQEINKEIMQTRAIIAASTGQLGNFIKGTQRSTRAMSELKGQIGMAFSVQSIVGFIKRVAQVTGETELQHRALQAIVQDKYKADEIWSQTLQNAMKSPFSVTQVLEHTKKLAAYRIEADKLVETTRMLGDISAGVGVDMNRLVLAYGQVRAATYLRASELRQFTEAGIPLLDELANYFSKLEGKVVTTGEVFNRISDKAVAFKDVETVIGKMTDEGGVFFNMQEIQSETLAGKIAKLKDAYTLMLAEIGNDNKGFLTGVIDATNELIQNWEKFAPLIQGILAGIVAKGLASMAVNIGTIIVRIKTASTAASALGKTLMTISKMSMGGWLAIVGVLTTLVTTIWNATNATDELTKKMSKIDSEVLGDLEDAKEMFKELADEVRSSTTTYKDREDALDKLQRKYKDILPDYMLELDYLTKMKQGYEEANASMELFYANEARKKKEKLINEEYDTDIQKNIGKVDEDDDYAIENTGGYREIKQVKFNGEDNVQLIEKTIAELESGKIKAEEFGNELNKAFRKFYNLPENVHLADKKFLDVIDKVTEKYKKLENVKVGFYDTPEEKQSLIELKKHTDGLEEQKEKFKKLESFANAYYELLRNPPQEPTFSSTSSEDEIAKEKQEYEASQEQYKADLQLAKDNVLAFLQQGITANGQIVSEGIGMNAQNAITWLDKAMTSSTDLTYAMDTLGVSMYNSFLEGVTGSEAVESQMQILGNTAREEIAPEQWQIAFAEIQKGIFDTHGLALSDIDGANVYAYTSLQDYSTALQKIYDEFNNQKIRIDLAKETFNSSSKLQQMFKNINDYLKFLGLGDLESADAVTKKMEALIKTASATGYPIKTGGGGGGRKSSNKPKAPKSNKEKGDSPLQRYKDAQAFIEQMDEEFKELAETMKPEEALKTIKKIYEKTAKEVFKDFKWNINSLEWAENAEGVEALTKNLEKLKKAVTGKKDSGNFLRDLEVAISKVGQKDIAESTTKKLEKTKEQIEDLFSGYDLFGSLEEMGVSKDFAKQFFGIDAFSLSDIKENISKALEEGIFDGTSGLEAYQELMEKVREKEQQEREQDLQHYIETSQEALTDAAKIKMQLAIEERKILNAFSVEDGVEETESQKQRREQMKQQALEGAQKKASDKLRKIEWEEFMNTETFQKLMGDLENTSIAGLRHMKEKLLEYKEAWKDTPELLDDVIKKLQDVEDAMTEANIKANPFKAFRDAKAANIKELRKGRSDADIEIENAILSKANRNYNNEISDLQLFLTTATDPGQVANTKRLIKEKENLIKKNEEQIKQNNAIIKSSKDQMKALDGQKEVYEKIQSSVADFGGALSELWEVFGEGDDVTGKSIDFGFDMADQVTQIITMVITTKQLKLALDDAGQGAEAFGAKLNMALGIIGWITMAISLVAKVWSFANEIHDDKLNKKIDDYKKNIEELEKSYEALEEAIESAYDSALLSENFDEANRNLEQRIAYEEAILEAEQSKKKKDQDAIDEAKESIDELREEQKQLLKDTAEDLGAIYDVRGAAKDFVDAWMEAFKETGNGLKGLKENFKETFRDIMLQQAVMTGAGAIMKPLFDEINTALENDFVVDDTEYKNINKIADDQLGALDSFLTSFYEKYPDVFEAASELSGLQAGIEGITEQQAEVISAYLNSIRFFVHSIDENTKRLAEQGLTSTDMANKLARANNEAALSGSQQDENPMLSQLQMLVEQTKAINDLLGSVTRHGHTKGGYGLKVFID